MTAAQLIKRLKKLDPKTPIYIDGESAYANCPVRKLEEAHLYTKTGSLRTKRVMLLKAC